MDTTALKARWESIASVSPSVLKEVLDPLRDRLWVLNQCVSRIFPSYDENQLLLDYGLQNSVPYSLYQTLISNSSENVSLSSFTNKPLQLSADDLVWCFFHFECLHLRDLLQTYREISLVFNGEEFRRFRQTSLVDSASSLALEEKFSALKVLLSRHWVLLEKHWLSIMKLVPETCAITTDGYKAVLPTPAGPRPSASVSRKKDWVEERAVLELLSRSQAEREAFSARAGLHVAAYLDAITQVQDGNTSARSARVSVRSTEELLSWYAARARELDSRSGRSDNALALVEFGRTQLSGGLEALHSSLTDVCTLVYSHGQHELSLEQYEKMSMTERLGLFFANVTGDDKSFVSNVTEAIMPSLVRSCATQLDAERTLCDYLVQQIAPTRFPLVMAILQHGIDQPSVRIVKNANLLVGTIVSASYAAAELNSSTKALLSRLPATMDRLCHEISSLSDSKSRMDMLSKHILCWEILRSYTLEWTLKEVAALSQNRERAEYVLRFLTQQGPSKRKTRESIIALARPDSVLWTDLLSDLNTLMNSGVLNAVSRAEVNALFCFGALLSGRYDDVQKHLCNKHMLERERAVEVSLKAAQTYLNAAASLSDLEAIRHAQKCVNVLLNSNVASFGSDSKLLDERNFILAVENLATTPAWRKVIGSRSPLEIRLADKLSLLLLLLHSSNTAYEDVWKLLELAKLLQGASTASAVSASSLIFTSETASLASTSSTLISPVSSGSSLNASSSAKLSYQQISTQLLIAAAEIALRAHDLPAADRIVCTLIRNNESSAWEVAIAVAHTLPTDSRLRAGSYGHIMRLLSFAATYCSTEPPKLTSMSLLPAQYLCSSPLNRLLQQFALLLAVRNSTPSHPSKPLRGLRDDPIDSANDDDAEDDNDDAEEEPEDNEANEEENTDQTSAAYGAADTSDADSDSVSEKREKKPNETISGDSTPTLEALLSHPHVALLPDTTRFHSATTLAGDTPLMSHPFYRLQFNESYLTGATRFTRSEAQSNATALVFSVLQLKSIFDVPSAHSIPPLTCEERTTLVHTALSLDPALAAACALTCASPEDLIAVVRSECSVAHSSGSAKRASQVKAWGMCVLALEAHRRLSPSSNSNTRLDPRYQLAPDDLISSVRTLSGVSGANPAVALLIAALEELSLMAAPAAAAGSTDTPALTPMSSAEGVPKSSLSRELSHSSLVLEVQVDLAEWSHESYRHQVASGLKALPAEQITRLMQELALSDDLRGEEFRVVCDLFPLVFADSSAQSLQSFYAQLSSSLLDTMASVDEAEWNRRSAQLTRIVKGIVAFKDILTATVVLDRIVRACDLSPQSRGSVRARHLVSAFRTECPVALDVSASLKSLVSRYAQAEIVDRWSWPIPPNTSFSDSRAVNWLTDEVLPKLDSAHYVAALEDLLRLLQIGNAPTSLVVQVFLDALKHQVPISRLISLLQPFQLSEQEESALLDACEKFAYPLDAILAFGMHSSREPLLTRTVFQLAAGKADQLRGPQYSAFFQQLIAKGYLLGVRETSLFSLALQWVIAEHRRLTQSLSLLNAGSLVCAEHHVLLRAVSQLCNKGLIIEASELALSACGPSSELTNLHGTWLSYDSAIAQLQRCLRPAVAATSVSSSAAAVSATTRPPLLAACSACAPLVQAAARELDAMLM